MSSEVSVHDHQLASSAEAEPWVKGHVGGKQLPSEQPGNREGKTRSFKGMPRDLLQPDSSSFFPSPPNNVILIC